jgi:tRNA threonylcarbamoyladenosine biosynthesis protein TsaB
LNPDLVLKLPITRLQNYKMLLLAIDTSGKNSSLALARVREGSPEVELVEAVPLAGGTFSTQLVPQIATLLKKHGYTKSELSGFVVISGPGSFTGLRVGLAAIKALAEVLQKPIAAVSLLEAVAWASGKHGRVVAVLDAGRSDIYAGDCELEDFPKMHSERLLTRDEFIAEATANASVVVTPDAALVETLRTTTFAAQQISYPSSEVIALLGWQHIQRGQVVTPEELEANYIRRSGAEMFPHPRH